MWYKGVSFTSEKCSLIYLVDQAGLDLFFGKWETELTLGTRTTTDYFADLDYDFSEEILLRGARTGPAAIEACLQILRVILKTFQTI